MHKDELGRVIYVGKAISLRNRVRQYFQNGALQNPKLRAMVPHIAEFDYITAANEMEALILECNLIKKYMPKYNVLLRDDKTYPYIKVTTSEAFPRVVKTRRIERDGNRYFGPYSDAGAVNDTVDILGDIYCLKRCSADSFPDDFRPCLNFFIGKCRGICIGKADKEDYGEAISEILHFLSGRDKSIIKNLRNKMQSASEETDYEKAAKLRDHIQVLEELGETQRVTMINDEDADILIPVKNGETAVMVLFPVREGKLIGRETFPLKSGEEDEATDIISGFIKQYYTEQTSLPSEILVGEDLPDKKLLSEMLSDSGHRVTVKRPVRGSKKALMDLTYADADQMSKDLAQRARNRKERNERLTAAMDSVLDMTGYTRPACIRNRDIRVEAYDISNTNGIDSVGAMVVFQGLRPLRKDYRRFRIKMISGPDDYGSLREVLTRRFIRALDGDKAFELLPDIIFMDGGSGQVHVAESVLESLDIKIPVAGMVKDANHRTSELIFSNGNKMNLKEEGVLFNYVGRIQEEVHRFAIEYHRKLRSNRTVESELTRIPGIGVKRRDALMRRFKSIDAIKNASIEELVDVPNITEIVANNIVEFFATTNKKTDSNHINS